MSDSREAVALLLGQIHKAESVLARITREYDEFLKTDFRVLGRKNTSAIVVAEFLVDYYTCLETCFLRISQFFENNLRKDQWHADLLEKMTLRVERVREPVISDHTQSLLGELLKFRHFRRYYFEIEYDWDKLDYLQKKFAEIRPRVNSELQEFEEFLQALQSDG
jgi:hypothetical protein